VVVIVGTIIFAILKVQNNFISIYHTFGLNTQILQFSGVLLGLLLTAYGIIFGVAPAINKEILKTKGFRKINFSYLVALFILTIVVVDSFFIFFVTGNLQNYLIWAQLWLLSIVVAFVFVLIAYLYFILETIRR
jgi:hypothetical protein